MLPAIAVNSQPGSVAAVEMRPATGAVPGKLRKAAQDFEGILISSLWQAMEKDAAFSNDENEAENSAIKQYAMTAMCSALASRGGLGIAQMILSSVQDKAD